MILHSFSSLLLSPIFYFTLLLSSVRSSDVKGSLFRFFAFLIDTFYAIKEVEVEQESMSSFLLLLPSYGMDMQLVTWIMI
jgi:hypothetical protein